MSDEDLIQIKTNELIMLIAKVYLKNESRGKAMHKTVLSYLIVAFIKEAYVEEFFDKMSTIIRNKYYMIAKDLRRGHTHE